MTVKMNQKDEIKCYICGKDESCNQEETFESVTLNETIDYSCMGTYTFFLCPKCRRDALAEVVGAEFRKRYKKANGNEWATKEVHE